MRRPQPLVLADALSIGRHPLSIESRRVHALRFPDAYRPRTFGEALRHPVVLAPHCARAELILLSTKTLWALRCLVWILAPCKPVGRRITIMRVPRLRTS